jgi:ABC-type amino acid transport substrate-binding protein
MQGGRLGSVRRRRAPMAVCMAALLASPLLLAQASTAPGSTLDRVRAAGRIRLGYRSDARPFAYGDDAGQPAGYSVAMCQLIADAVKAEPGLASTIVEWVSVPVGERFSAVQQGRIDLLCGAETETLARRAQASFSIPIYPGGIGALVRSDSPVRLREVLSGRGQAFRPTWRAAATQVLQARAFSAVQGTTADKWLTSRIKELQVIADVAHVDGYSAGIQGLLDRRSDVFFAERAVLLDSARRHAGARDLLVIDRLFTYEPLALAMPTGDEQFRLLVDRTLSRLYSSGEIGALYTKWFGEPDEAAMTFFRWNTLAE